MKWPSNIPPDLRDRLDSVMDTRSYGAADIWGTLKEWLENHGIEPVALPEEKPREHSGRF